MDSPHVVLALTADDDRFADARRTAEEAAQEAGAALILYDWDAAMLLGDPLPSIWSGDGTDKAVPDRLDARALDAAGRSAIADQVRDAQRRGIDASAWLPSTHDADAVAQYAVDHAVTEVVLPADLDGRPALEEALAARGIRTRIG